MNLHFLGRGHTGRACHVRSQCLLRGRAQTGVHCRGGNLAAQPIGQASPSFPSGGQSSDREDIKVTAGTTMQGSYQVETKHGVSESGWTLPQPAHPPGMRVSAPPPPPWPPIWGELDTLPQEQLQSPPWGEDSKPRGRAWPTGKMEASRWPGVSGDRSSKEAQASSGRTG